MPETSALAPEHEALAQGLAPTEVMLAARLQPGRLPLPARIESRAAGGDGFVCCGAFRHVVVEMPSAALALTPSMLVMVTTPSKAGHTSPLVMVTITSH